MNEENEIKKQIEKLEKLIEEEKSKPTVSYRSSNMVCLYNSLAELKKELKKFMGD